MSKDASLYLLYVLPGGVAGTGIAVLLVALGVLPGHVITGALFGFAGSFIAGNVGINRLWPRTGD